MMFRCELVSPFGSVRWREGGTVSPAILMIHVAAGLHTCNLALLKTLSLHRVFVQRELREMLPVRYVERCQLIRRVICQQR